MSDVPPPRKRPKDRWYLEYGIGVFTALLLADKLYGREGYSFADLFVPPLLWRVVFMCAGTALASRGTWRLIAAWEDR